jgi:hypothetical protein
LSNNTIPININLYDLKIADSTSFKITYYDCNYLKVADAIIDTFRKYIGDGQFTSVEMSKTNTEGSSVVHLVTEDIISIYNWWGIADSNAIRKTFYDKNINPGVGKIEFEPPLNSMIPNAGVQ